MLSISSHHDKTLFQTIKSPDSNTGLHDSSEPWHEKIVGEVKAHTVSAFGTCETVTISQVKRAEKKCRRLSVPMQSPRKLSWTLQIKYQTPLFFNSGKVGAERVWCAYSIFDYPICTWRLLRFNFNFDDLEAFKHVFSLSLTNMNSILNVTALSLATNAGVIDASSDEVTDVVRSRLVKAQVRGSTKNWEVHASPHKNRLFTFSRVHICSWVFCRVNRNLCKRLSTSLCFFTSWLNACVWRAYTEVNLLHYTCQRYLKSIKTIRAL